MILSVLLFVPSLAVLAQGPNIIYINTDDWGIGKVPGYATDEATRALLNTPNIDRLREQGMTFTNSYAGNAVCGPSRCSLLTGKMPGYAAWRANRPRPLVQWPPADPMLGRVAQQAGYRTAGFGKLSHGGASTPQEITDTGWDYWLGYLTHVDCRDYYAKYIYENGERIAISENTDEVLAGTMMSAPGDARLNAPRDGSRLANEQGSGVVDGGTFTEYFYGEKIVGIINEDSDKPFFIYYASTVPHGGKPGGMRVPDLAGYENVEGLTQYERVYLALMTHHDIVVGRILAALEEKGIAENTIVIWTSDNGDEDSYYGRTETFDGNADFRMMKRSLYEGGIRTPMYAYWPGTIEPGSTTDLITTQTDLMPTIADAGGAALTDAMQGISIFPTLAGKPDDQTDREYIYFEFYERGPQQSVRMGKWKAYRKGGSNQPTELYDLDADPGEENDLAAQHPDLIERMNHIMATDRVPNPAWKMPGLDD